MRLVTRADLDGLACAVLITSCESIEEVQLVHPQDITGQRLHIGEDDILASLPYHPDCSKWFDHHLLTEVSQTPPDDFSGRYGLAPSAARVVYEHYMCDHPEIRRYERLLLETDRFDSAHLTLDDVLDPREYILLGFTLDPRTGLGTGFHDYFMKLLGWLKSTSLEEILKQPEVENRVARMRGEDSHFREVTRSFSRLDGNVIYTDFRAVSPIPIGNRFLIYTLFPEANISIRVQQGPTSEHVAVTVGHSIFTRTSRTNVGELMAGFGGGGHRGAGSCLLLESTAEEEIALMIETMKRDG